MNCGVCNRRVIKDIKIDDVRTCHICRKIWVNGLKQSRNVNYDMYETTIIPADKICKIFLFNFRDGLYYIKYRKSKFDTFERKIFVRNQRDDYNDIPKEYIYIPINKLKKIN